MRRDRDSNPGCSCPHNGFRDRPIQPLWHLSVRVQISYNRLYFSKMTLYLEKFQRFHGKYYDFSKFLYTLMNYLNHNARLKTNFQD